MKNRRLGLAIICAWIGIRSNYKEKITILFDALYCGNKYFHADNEAIIYQYYAEIVFMRDIGVKRICDIEWFLLITIDVEK